MNQNEEVKNLLTNKTCSNCDYRYIAKGAKCYFNNNTCENWVKMSIESESLKIISKEIQDAIDNTMINTIKDMETFTRAMGLNLGDMDDRNH
jgi:excinuclease UvrABC ATPase subunit